MAQRRKTVASVTTNYSDIAIEFQHVATEVAKLYHNSLNLQPLSFHAGRKHSLTKAFDWISSQTQEGKSVTSAEVIAYLQDELKNSATTDSPLELETFAQRSGFCQSETSQDAQIEVNAASSCSTASIENQGSGENETMPQDMEEDTTHV